MLLPLAILSCCGRSGTSGGNVQKHQSQERAKEYVITDTTNAGLIIYTPTYSRIALECGTMPEQANESIIFCCSAAFTGELRKEFSHSNIAGHHVSGGKLHKGFRCKPNTGAFVWYSGQWKFMLNEYADEMMTAADSSGMGFAQNIIIHNGITQPHFRKNSFQYRALCELDGKLCVIESKHIVKYAEFVNMLNELQVKHAIYLDMGSGWNHAWYRKDSQSDVVVLHPKTHNYMTNWLTFYIG